MNNTSQIPVAVATWLFAGCCVGLLWKVGYAGPTACSVLLGLCALAAVFLLVRGLFGIRSAAKKVAALNLLIAMATGGAAGFFAFQVLANEDGPITVSGPQPFLDGSLVHSYPEKIRIFNLNVLHGYPDFEKQHERFTETAAEMKGLKADILILQETWTVAPDGCLAERLSEELGYNFVYGRANGLYSHIGFEEGGAILSRFQIREAKRICLKPCSPWWENRVALVARMDDRRMPITVVGVHLSTSASADAQAEYLLDLLRDSPPEILAGDFNSLPGSRALKAILDAGFIEAAPGNKSAEPWIDHVFFSANLLKRYAISETSWVIATQPVPGVRDAISDHDGILVELTARPRR